MNVQGKNVIVKIKVAGVYTPYLCARSASISISTDFIETSVSGTGLNATFLPTKNSFTCSMEGVVSLNDPAGVTLADLRGLQLAQSLLEVSYERTDDGGAIYNEEFTAYISSSSDTGSFDDMNTFSIELRGTGAITQHES